MDAPTCDGASGDPGPIAPSSCGSKGGDSWGDGGLLGQKVSQRMQDFIFLLTKHSQNQARGCWGCLFGARKRHQNQGKYRSWGLGMPLGGLRDLLRVG